MTLGDITTKIYKLTKTNASDYDSANLLIDINNAYERVASLILAYDSRWQFDDGNQTDLPISTEDLISGQQDYSIPVSYLSLDRLEVKDTSGNWHLLKQIDQQQKKGSRATSLTDYKKGGGTPDEYDLVANSVFLYAAPNYSQLASLKFYFTRSPVLFTSADLNAGTASPGFNSLYHSLISYLVAYDYAVLNIPELANGYLIKVQQLEQGLRDFYGMRNRDNKSSMRPRRDSNK